MENPNSTTVAATGGAPAAEASAKTQEQVAAAQQQQKEASTTVTTVTAIAEGGVSVDAAKMERERIQAIVNSEQGKAQPALAEHFAYNTGMSADDAIKALDAAAKDKPQTDADSSKSGANSGFETAMEKGNPDIGADTAELTGDDKVIAESLSLYNGAFKG